jgi:N-acetylmuramoyl-L-alanine amidase
MSPRIWIRSAGGVGLAVLLAIAVTASAGGGGRYTVRPGDTLSAIAARYDTTVEALVRLNNLPGNGNLIYAGSTIRLPGHGRHAHARHGRTVVTTYVVKPGDSLYAIASRFHASADRIARRNHLPSSLVVVIGQKLRVPHHVAAARHHHTAAVPSRETVAALIRSTSRRWGVGQSLALAVSYMEAGFNQSMVSKVGAVGAMQIMPATGRWLSAYVVHRTLDIHKATDNVTAGVALLSVLLRETNGNVRVAVAGYYQGLASVRQRGMYDDTKRYVANVLALRNRF